MPTEQFHVHPRLIGCGTDGSEKVSISLASNCAGMMFAPLHSLYIDLLLVTCIRVPFSMPRKRMITRSLTRCVSLHPSQSID